MILNEVMTQTADAIREKTGKSEKIAPINFAEEIKSISLGGGDAPTKPKYTGHADAEGLKAIGWTDEDIAYYQENGVNWNEEDDEWHKVAEDNKALYGVLTASNISTYKDRIVYLPKIDTSNVTDMSNKFYNCYYLKGLPLLDTSNCTFMMSTFENCYSLTYIPHIDTSKVSFMTSMFSGCTSLTHIPLLDTGSATNMSLMFNGCTSLVNIPKINMGNVKNINQMFDKCRSLTVIPDFDEEKMSQGTSAFYECYSITKLNIKNKKSSFPLQQSPRLSKSSLLYIINNEAATSAITITLASYAYERLANDADVVAALANHPNITLAK